MKNQRTTILILILIASLIAVGGAFVGIHPASSVQPAQAQAPDGQAFLSVTATQLRWSFQTEYDHYVLVIGKDEYYLRNSFAAGSAAVLNIVDAQGQRLPDGLFGYTLTAYQPSGEVAETQTGFFRVLNGAFVIPSSESDTLIPDAPQAPDDQVIADDLIVTGSFCVGFDCVENESFGFDTIRLKENNTRIAFDDTSATAGFPANDWQIVANDSASGGANYLAIYDGTGYRTPFRVMAGAPTNALVVTGTGVGLGTNIPQDMLNLSTVVPTYTLGIRFDNQANDDHWRVYLSTEGKMQIAEASSTKPEFSLDQSGNLFITGSLAVGSDAASKHQFSTVNSASVLQRISSLPITTWSYKTDEPGVRHLGPTAQDFYASFKLGANETSISPLDTSSVALVGIQELSKTVDSQQAYILALEARLAALEKEQASTMTSTAKWSIALPWFLLGLVLAGGIGWRMRS